MELNKFNQSTKYFTRSESGPTYNNPIAGTIEDEPEEVREVRAELKRPPVFETDEPKEAVKEVLRRSPFGKISEPIPIMTSEKANVSLDLFGNPATDKIFDPSIQGQVDVGGGKLGFGIGEDKGSITFRKQFDEGGVVEREGFRKGPPNPKGRSEDLLTGRGANNLIDAFIKAHAKDDISFLFQKTAANPNGVLDKEGLKALSKVINNPKGLEKFVEKTKLDADTIYDMLDEREAFKNLDLESAMKKSSTARTREQIKTTLSNGEDWLIKNSKNYDTVKDLKKGFKRVFGKNHPFLKESLTFTEDNLTKFKPLFFDDIKLTKTPGATPSYKLQKYSLDQLFNASLYNFNPEVRDEVLNDLNDILSQKVTTKTKGDIRKQLLNNKRLTELGINKRLQGPITRLLIKDINEDIVENLKFIKQPIRGTPNLLNYLKDKVDPKYRKQFDLASKAITQIQAKKYNGAKETLNIAENINFDHKIPQSVIELGYADEIEFAKVNPVGENFNLNVKRTQFDSKINRLLREYEATPNKDKPKIIKKMNAVKNSFNKRYNNYLGDISIKQVDGKLTFSSKAKVLETGTDIMKALKTNIKKTPNLFQLKKSLETHAKKLDQQGLGSRICGRSTGGTGGNDCVNLVKRNPAKFALRAIAVGTGAELAAEIAFALPSFAEGKPYSVLLNESILGLTGLGTSEEEFIAKLGGPKSIEAFQFKKLKEEQEKDKQTYFALQAGLEGEDEAQVQAAINFFKKQNILKKQREKLMEDAELVAEQQKKGKLAYQDILQKTKEEPSRKFARQALDIITDPFRRELDLPIISPEGPIGTDLSLEKNTTQDLKTGLRNLPSDIEQDVSEMGIMGEASFALGGRVDFKNGGMDRRSFLKLVGGLASLPVLGKFFKFVKPATKKVLENAPTGTPDWFAPLVEKIAKEGIDISDKAAMIERQTVKELKTPDGTYTLTQTPDTGEITVSVDTLAGVNDAPVDFVMTPNRITDIAEDGKPIVDRGEFNIIEMRPTGKMVGPEDYDINLDEFVTNNLDDVASDWHAVEEFATGKTSKPAQASRRQFKQSVEEDPLEDVLNRQGDYDPPEPELDYD